MADGEPLAAAQGVFRLPARLGFTLRMPSGFKLAMSPLAATLVPALVRHEG